MGRFKAAAFYVRTKRGDRWSCCLVLEGEPRSLAEAVAALLTTRYGQEFVVHTRQRVDTPGQVTRSIEESRLEWDAPTINAFVDQARAERKGGTPLWTFSAAVAARRGLADLEAAILADPRPASEASGAAKLPEHFVDAIRAGHTLRIELDMIEGA